MNLDASCSDGTATFLWTNDQSGRLMFYHDHAYGLTRLNVYAGEAAGYLIVDPVEDDLIDGTNVTGGNPGSLVVLPNQGGGVYNYGIPLIIQDKTWVPPTTTPAAGQQFIPGSSWTTAGGQLAAQDPTWTSTWCNPTVSQRCLWFPHVYMPNQNPRVPSGVDEFGRWDYGMWFWPPLTTVADGGNLVHGEVPCPTADNPAQVCPGVPNVSLTPESFMDTPVVNGTAYPYCLWSVRPTVFGS